MTKLPFIILSLSPSFPTTQFYLFLLLVRSFLFFSFFHLLLHKNSIKVFSKSNTGNNKIRVFNSSTYIGGENKKKDIKIDSEVAKEKKGIEVESNNHIRSLASSLVHLHHASVSLRFSLIPFLEKSPPNHF